MLLEVSELEAGRETMAEMIGQVNEVVVCRPRSSLSVCQRSPGGQVELALCEPSSAYASAETQWPGCTYVGASRAKMDAGLGVSDYYHVHEFAARRGAVHWHALQVRRRSLPAARRPRRPLMCMVDPREWLACVCHV